MHSFCDTQRLLIHSAFDYLAWTNQLNLQLSNITHLITAILHQGKLPCIVNHADGRVVDKKFLVATPTPWHLMVYRTTVRKNKYK